jgi:hypothetical protein
VKLYTLLQVNASLHVKTKPEDDEKEGFQFDTSEMEESCSMDNVKHDKGKAKDRSKSDKTSKLSTGEMGKQSKQKVILTELKQNYGNFNKIFETKVMLFTCLVMFNDTMDYIFFVNRIVYVNINKWKAVLIISSSFLFMVTSIYVFYCT